VQRCVYGVDRNPMATDLAKLSLWLATLAKDHPFTFLDHSLRSGDALVGLSKKQIIAFHWDLNSDQAKQRKLGEQRLEKDIERAISYRREILEGGDFLMPEVKAERLKRADSALDEARRTGDLCLAAFFNGDKPRTRAALRDRYLDTLIEIASTKDIKENFTKTNEVKALVAQLRQAAPHSVTPFHWEIEFPEVFARQNGGFDAFIGNPPYGGKNTIIEGNHESYPDWLKAMHEESHGNSDLVAHFFRRTFNLLRRDGTFGLIATNTIRQGDTRETGLRWICVKGEGTVFAARRRYKWVGAAAVVVSVVWVIKGRLSSPFDLDGQSVPIITAYLFHDGGHESPALLSANARKSFVGSYPLGMGFTFDDTDRKGVTNSLADMAQLIAKDSRNAERIFPYLGGEEVNDDPQHSHHRFIIDFFNFPLCRSDLGATWREADDDQRDIWFRSGIVPKDYPGHVAADWPDLIKVVEDRVKPDRDTQKRDANRERWWQYAEKRPGLYAAIAGLPKVLVMGQTSKYRALTFLNTGIVFDQKIIVFPTTAYSAFAAMQSRIHDVWALFFGSTMKDDPVYTPNDCFETFPFPAEWETDATLEAVGQAYYKFRAELMVANNEGLTTTYNRFHDLEESDPGILRLRELHVAMDHAVLTAYGWSDLVESGRTTCDFIPDYYDEPEEEGGDPIPKSIRYRWPDATRDEVLARLLKLNAERHAQEVRQGLHSPAAQKAVKKVTAKKVARKAPKAADGPTSEPAPRPDSARPAQQSLQFAPEDLALFQKPGPKASPG
jgi:hypothetical protein